MDYKEAIEELESLYRHCSDMINEFEPNSVWRADCKALDVAISAVQELQMYKDNDKRNLSRTDRLMDECTYRHENGNCLRVGGFCTSVPLSHCQRYKDWYTDYRGYKKLGTLEEVRDAVEKQKAKKTVIEDICRNGVDFYGIVYQEKASVYKCPACDSFVGFVGEDQCISCCACCGQKLDWTEAEE